MYSVVRVSLCCQNSNLREPSMHTGSRHAQPESLDFSNEDDLSNVNVKSLVSSWYGDARLRNAERKRTRGAGGISARSPARMARDRTANRPRSDSRREPWRYGPLSRSRLRASAARFAGKSYENGVAQPLSSEPSEFHRVPEIFSRIQWISSVEWGGNRV